MLTLKSIGKFVAALEEMIIISCSSPKEENSLISACDGLMKDVLKKGIPTVAIEIATNLDAYNLNGAGLLLICYETGEAGAYKVIVRGHDYGRYMVTGPRLNEVLAKYGLQEEHDSPKLKGTLAQNPASPISGRRTISHP